MRKILLVAVTSLILGAGVSAAAAGGIRERDVSTQRDVATGQKPASAAASAGAKTDAGQDNSTYGLAPGFVTPFGYPLPAYADGNNFQTIYTGR